MNNLRAEKNRRVLVIDDNRAIHDDFRKILAPAPDTGTLNAAEAALFGHTPDAFPTTRFEVDSAYQGQDGVLLAAKAKEAGRPYAMAFVDVRMPPGWDGVETTGKLWELDPSLQVVLCTAYSDYSWGEMFEQLGQRDGLLILKKPFDSVEAFQLAHALTEKWWLHQESRRKMEELERRVAERTQELARSLSLLNATLESTADGIVAVDLSGKIVSYNAKFAATWQFPAGTLARQDAAATRAHTAGQVKDPVKFLELVKAVEINPEAESFDVIELIDGRIFERYVFPQRIDGACVGTVINWRDITERQRAEAELQEKTAFLEAQVNSSIDGILVVDQEGKQALQNQRFVELLKIPQDIAAEKSDERRLRWVTDQSKHPEQFAEKVQYLYAHPDEVSRDVIELKDGGILDRYSSPVVGKDGKYYGRIWTFRDITESRRAEEALRESEERFAGAFEHAPIGVALVSPDGHWLQVNRVLCDLVGYSETELLTRTFQDITHPDDLAADLDNVRRLIAGEIRSYQMEKRYLHKAGHLVTVLLDVSLVRDDQGRPRYFISQIQDISARKQAAAALLESKRFLQSTLNALSSHIAILDEHGNIVEVNAAWNRFARENKFMGGGRGVGDNYLQLCDSASGNFSDEAPVVARGIRAVMAGQSDEFHLEYPCHSPRRQRWFIVRVTRFGGDGPVRVVAAHENITERKLAEDRLGRTEELYRRAINGAGAVPYASDYRTKSYVFMGEGIEQLIGYPPHEVTGQLWKQIIQESVMAGDTAGLTKEEASRRMATGELRNWRCDMRVRTRNGKLRWLSDASVQKLDAAGRPIGAMGILQDITERKRNEITALAFSKLGARLSSVNLARETFDIIKEVSRELFGWDAFCIRLYNAQADSIYSGFTIDTFDGQTVAGEQSAPKKPDALYRRIIARGGELILRDQPPSFGPDTDPFGHVSRPSAALMFVPIRSRSHVVGILSVQSYTSNAYNDQDLRILQTLADQCGGAIERIWADEALRKAEAQLLQAQKMETVGKLAGGVAHEFNSILTAILGQSELILTDLPPGHPLSQNAAGIHKAAERAAALTRQLLAYGRKSFLRPESLDLNQILAGMENTIRQLMGRDVDVRILPAAGLHAVEADAGQVEQIIINLAMNARDAMPKGGKLTLETANVSFHAESVGRYPELPPGDYVLLAITDSGTGMTEAVRARVFEPFFTTKGVGQGTGLGLSTCYGIIKQSGGHISVYSELTRGATFKIYLPQVESAAKIPLPRPANPDLPRGTETILLVEDDPALREMAASLLQRLGYTVLTAADGVEALNLHQQRDAGAIDLLFTDVVMPHMSGKELADRVQVLAPHTRILFTSAFTENAIVHQGVLDPGVALLQKPFTPTALAHKLREVLDQPGTAKGAAPEKPLVVTKTSGDEKPPGD